MYRCASVFAGNLNQHPHDVTTMAFFLAFFSHVGRSADGHLRRKMRETLLQEYTPVFHVIFPGCIHIILDGMIQFITILIYDDFGCGPLPVKEGSFIIYRDPQI